MRRGTSDRGEAMAIRVLVAHQGCIPIYRAAFFERLQEIAPGRYVVAHGDAPPGSHHILAPPPYRFATVPMRNRILHLGGGRMLIWQGLVGPVLKRRFTAAVVGDEMKFLAGPVLLLTALLHRRPILLWGFGYRVAPRRTVQHSWIGRRLFFAAAALKRSIGRLSAGYLAYTDGGRAALVASGYPAHRIAVLRNTVDTASQAKQRMSAAQEPIERSRQAFDLPADRQVLLYFGRFLATKRVDLLVEYARRRQDGGRPIALVIFGAGAERDRLGRAAAGLDAVRFRAPDDLALARALRIAEAVVIPGYVGLAVTHAFAHGVPVITRDGQSHSPEIEYLRHGENGLVLPAAPAAFYTGLDRYLGDAALRARLRAGAERTGQSFDLTLMARRFDDHVMRIVAPRRKGPSGRKMPRRPTG
jgi:glycosyltransferase involved in cell wall biosynthesis